MDFYSEASSRPFTHGQISWVVRLSAINLSFNGNFEMRRAEFTDPSVLFMQELHEKKGVQLLTRAPVRPREQISTLRFTTQAQQRGRLQ